MKGRLLLTINYYYSAFSGQKLWNLSKSTWVTGPVLFEFRNYNMQCGKTKSATTISRWKKFDDEYDRFGTIPALVGRIELVKQYRDLHAM